MSASNPDAPDWESTEWLRAFAEEMDGRKSGLGTLADDEMALIIPLLPSEDAMRLRATSRRMRRLVDLNVTDFAFFGPMEFSAENFRECVAYLNRLPKLRTLRAEGAAQARALANVAREVPRVRCLYALGWTLDMDFYELGVRAGLHLRPAVTVDLYGYLSRRGWAQMAHDDAACVREHRRRLAAFADLLGVGEPEPLECALSVVSGLRNRPALRLSARALASVEDGADDGAIEAGMTALGAAATSMCVEFGPGDDALPLALAPSGFALGARCTRLDVWCRPEYNWRARDPAQHAALAAALAGCVPHLQELRLGVNNDMGHLLTEPYAQILGALPPRMRSVTLHFFESDEAEGFITPVLDAMPPGFAADRLLIHNSENRCSMPAALVRAPLVRAHAAAGTLCAGVSGDESEDTVRALIDAGLNPRLFVEYAGADSNHNETCVSVAAGIGAVRGTRAMRSLKIDVWDRRDPNTTFVLDPLAILQSPAYACAYYNMRFECRVVDGPLSFSVTL